jgi:hypothetical protein
MTQELRPDRCHKPQDLGRRNWAAVKWAAVKWAAVKWASGNGSARLAAASFGNDKQRLHESPERPGTGWPRRVRKAPLHNDVA